MSSDESTPYPGSMVDIDVAKPIINKFVRTYRGCLYDGMPDNVPTACTLDGEKDSSVFDSEIFRSKKSLYVLFESPYELYIASGEEIFQFYHALEPWEDYDFCVYDETLNWCIGVTHNEDVLVIDKNRVLER